MCLFFWLIVYLSDWLILWGDKSCCTIITNENVFMWWSVFLGKFDCWEVIVCSVLAVSNGTSLSRNLFTVIFKYVNFNVILIESFPTKHTNLKIPLKNLWCLFDGSLSCVSWISDSLTVSVSWITSGFWLQLKLFPQWSQEFWTSSFCLFSISLSLSLSSCMIVSFFWRSLRTFWIEILRLSISIWSWDWGWEKEQSLPNLQNPELVKNLQGFGCLQGHDFISQATCLSLAVTFRLTLR